MNIREKYIDYVKGIGILLIMLAHCIQYFKPMCGINGYICSFHVPIFFIVAGCLAYEKREKQVDKRTFVAKRARQLLIPYIIFSLINSALKLGVLFLKKTLTSSIFADEMQALLITGNGTVWFLVTLFGIEVAFVLLKPALMGGICRTLCLQLSV